MQKLYILLSLALAIQSCSHEPSRHDAHSKQKIEAEKDGQFEVIPMIGKFKAKRAMLPNGLKLIILKDDSSPTLAYQTWFDVGSRNEVVGKTGLAHLFEHLMFKGTKSRAEGQFDSILEQAGVEDENAFTTNDHTVYVQELPKDALNTIIELEADRMVNLIVNDTSFKMEREVVQNERRFRKENSAEGTIYQTLFETAYREHPYHWPVIGYEQDLNLMSAQDARNFYERYYSPDRATVVIVGDVNEDDVYRKIENAYGSIPHSKPAELQVITPEPEQTAQRRKRLSLNVEVEKLWMAFKISTASSPDTAALEVIQGLLSEGKNCRLNRALFDPGIVSQVGAGSLDMKDPGLFLIDVDMQKGKTSAVAEAIILRELDRLKNNPVNLDEIKRAQNIIRFKFIEKIATLKGKANFIGSSELQQGSLEAALNMQRQINEVTPEQIQQVALKYLDTSRLTVVTAVPKK